MVAATGAANGFGGTQATMVINKQLQDTRSSCISNTDLGECSASSAFPTVDATIDAASTCSESSASTLNMRESINVRKTFVHVDSDDGYLPLDRARKSRSRTDPVGFISSVLFMDVHSDMDNHDSSDEYSDADSDADLTKLPSMCKIKTRDLFDSPENRTIEVATAFAQEHVAISTSPSIFKIKTLDAFDTPASRTADAAVGFQESEVRPHARGMADGCEQMETIARNAFSVRNTFVCVDEDGGCLSAANRERSQTGPAAFDLCELVALGDEDDSGEEDLGFVEASKHANIALSSSKHVGEPPAGTNTAMNTSLPTDMDTNVADSSNSATELAAMQQRMMMTMLASVAPPMIPMRPLAMIPASFAMGCTQPSSSSCAMIAAQAATQAARAAQVVEANCAFAHANASSSSANARRKSKAKQNHLRAAHDHSTQDNEVLLAGTLEFQGQTSEKPTTVVVRNLPLNYRRNMLLKMLDYEGFAGDYDFVYLPVDFDTGSGLGYAFINLVSPDVVPRFWQALDGYNRWMFPSAKVLKVSWSTPHQGLAAHVKRFRNSPLMHESVKDDYRPIILEAGHRVAFPPATRALWAPKFTKTCETSVRANRKGK